MVSSVIKILFSVTRHVIPCRVLPLDPGALQGISRDKRHIAVEAKIDEMGLRQYCDKPAGGYSGGNKRKLSVAVAMIGNPQV